MPLFYYAGFKYEVRGYEVLKITYGKFYDNSKSYEDCLADLKKNVTKQLSKKDLSEFDEIIFVSKSIGTVIAGWLTDEFHLRVKHIFLTPVADTLPYIKGKNIIAVVAGTNDKQLDAEILKEHCEKTGVYLKQFEGVGHRLEVFGDMNVNLDILTQIVDLY